MSCLLRRLRSPDKATVMIGRLAYRLVSLRGRRRVANRPTAPGERIPSTAQASDEIASPTNSTAAAWARFNRPAASANRASNGDSIEPGSGPEPSTDR